VQKAEVPDRTADSYHQGTKTPRCRRSQKAEGRVQKAEVADRGADSHHKDTKTPRTLARRSGSPHPIPFLLEERESEARVRRSRPVNRWRSILEHERD